MPTRPQHRAHVVRRRHTGAVLTASALLIVVAVAVALLVTRAGGHKTASGGSQRHHHHRSHSAAPDRCPLTDLRPPTGKVPDRPALAVKIGNEPVGARPQSGLNEADIVYDTPAEGFIMRYIAVYQCTAASAVGPTRSVRWVDWHILANFTGRPILAFAGGINPDVSVVSALPWLRTADLLGAQYGAGYRTTNRVPPDNLYTSTSTLWGLFKGGAPPRPVFQYSSAKPSGATPVSKLAIDFSAGTDAEWTWDAAAGQFLHSYSGVPDIDALTGKQVSTTNIVVQVVHYRYGPYPESPGSTGDVESQVTGSGRGWVLRNGVEIPVTWHRPAAADATTFTDAAGHAVLLAPGRTWVEIVLDTIANSPGSITFTP